MTSFGGKGSDGLLSFSEIFDLRLDADVVILSACDTAGQASLAANREAGLSSGGDFALDGLVRAFVGAGGRVVVASHWPVPDQFDATKRLVTGMFSAPAGSGTASALRQAQAPLMDERDTSHPFYWAAFAVVGDGNVQLVPEKPQAVASLSR
jgi:CHAT domain-containing protein